MGLDALAPQNHSRLATASFGAQTAGMTDVPDKTLERQGEWTLTKDSLQRLLNWLDGGVDSDGYAYVEMRRRLRDYFARKNCRTARRPGGRNAHARGTPARGGGHRAHRDSRPLLLYRRAVRVPRASARRPSLTGWSLSLRATSRRSRPPRQPRTLRKPRAHGKSSSSAWRSASSSSIR